MVRKKLVPKGVNIRRWPPRQQYTKYKIKTLLPEQRKTQKFTDRWARTFYISHVGTKLGRSRCRKKTDNKLL